MAARTRSGTRGLTRRRARLLLDTTPAPLPARCEAVGWRTGCVYREEPGVWQRWGSIDAAVHKTVIKDYSALLLSLSKGVNATNDVGNLGVRVVLDAGANIGLASRLFARFFGPDTTVVGIEAQRDNHALARLNNEGSANVRVMHAALGSPHVPHWLTLRGGGQGREYGYTTVDTSHAEELGGGQASNASGEAQRVRKVNVPQLLHALCLPSIDFLKLDIEGGEVELLQAANKSSLQAQGEPGVHPFAAGGELEWLTHVRYAIVETHENGALTGADAHEMRVYHLKLHALRAAGMTVLKSSVRGESGLIACGSMLPATECARVCERLMDLDVRVYGQRGRFRCWVLPYP